MPAAEKTGIAEFEIDTSVWTSELLQILDWKRFEELVAAVIHRSGMGDVFRANGERLAIDLVARSQGAERCDIAVQCRHWRNRIGLHEVSAFAEAAHAQGYREALLVTSSTFTRAARQAFDGRTEIRLIDGDELIEGITDLGAAFSEGLLRHATRDEDFYVPSCPRCGTKMMLRRPRQGLDGMPYWSCRSYAVRHCPEWHPFAGLFHKSA